MKTIIHVNQHVIKSNRKNEQNDPVLTVKTYKTNEYVHEVAILDKDGEIAAVVRYSSDNPLSCGAEVWIEAYNEVLSAVPQI